MTYRISQKQKRNFRPRLIAHYGRVCFFCKESFLDHQHVINKMVNPLMEEFCHLNDKEYDNRIENLVLGHKMCNSKMKWDPKIKQMAIAQLRDNEITGIPGIELPQSTDDENLRDENEEIYSNTEFAKISVEYLEEKFKETKKLPYKATVDSITMRCFNQIGHGSQNTIRRIMDMLCSDEGSYYKYRDGGKQWITKNNPLFGK